MLQENTDVHGAMQYILGMHDRLADKFLQNYDKLPSWGEPIDSWVHRYVDGLGNWVRANDSWSFESWRYFKNDGLNIQKHRWVTLLPPVEDDELTSSIAPESRYILSAVIPKRPRPENVGIVAMDMYIPKRVCHLISTNCHAKPMVSTSSVYPSETSRYTTMFPKENIPLGSGRSTWHLSTTARTSIPSR